MRTPRSSIPAPLASVAQRSELLNARRFSIPEPDFSIPEPRFSIPGSRKVIEESGAAGWQWPQGRKRDMALKALTHDLVIL